MVRSFAGTDAAQVHLKPVASADTIPGVVERAACEHAGRAALRQGGATLRYEDLLESVRCAATAIIAAGVRSGQAVALWAPNSIDWAVTSLGALFAGAVVVPLNTRYTAVEAAEIIDRSDCRLVFAEGAFLGRSLAGEAAALPGHRLVVSLGAERVEGATALADFEASPSRELDRRLGSLRPADISHIAFTSGTTGRPKGAMLRHDAMVRTTIEWSRVVGLDAGDRYPIVSPFSHIGGHKTGLLATITAGATAFPFPTLDIGQLTETIDTDAITFLQGPPTMFHALVTAARTSPVRRFASVRVGVTGAATIPSSLIRELFDVVGIQSVFTAYGLSESTGVCTITRAGDPVETIAETSGRPIPGVEVRTANPDGSWLATGEQGEIVVRGMNLMAGYLDDPAATALAVRDGWLYTGDIGWIGEDGCLRIVDRVKDMVIVGGFNVYPAEVERVLLEHPDVSQAAVVGVPDHRLGEVPVAFVIATKDHQSTADDLVRFCRTRLANFKTPRHVWFVDTFPTNAAGKVVKAELRESAGHRLTL
jgi:acyl-CoA synthetase (AMP-forming)/AMP-acid ligase II